MANKYAQAARIATAIAWLTGFCFLIYFIVYSASLADKYELVQTSVASASAPLAYPGLFICMPVEALTNADNSPTPNTTVNVLSGAQISDNFGASVKAASSFYCPQTTTFEVTVDGEQGKVQCADFKFNPGQKDTCVTSAPTCTGTASFHPTCGGDAPAAWTSDTVDATVSMQLYIGTTGNTLPFPVQVLPYSSTSPKQPPTDANSYLKMFNSGSPYVQNLPTGSQSIVHITKTQGAQSFTEGSCALDKWDLSAHITAVESTSGKRQHNTRAALRFTYDTQEVIRTCSESVLNSAEVLGLVGGGSSLMIAFNLLVVFVINLVAKRAGESVFEPAGTQMGERRPSAMGLRGTPNPVGGSNPGVE